MFSEREAREWLPNHEISPADAEAIWKKVLEQSEISPAVRPLHRSVHRPLHDAGDPRAKARRFQKFAVAFGKKKPRVRDQASLRSRGT